MTIEIRVPTLGESVTEATVATWFKKPGDAVAVDEMLCALTPCWPPCPKARVPNLLRQSQPLQHRQNLPAVLT